MNRSRRIRGWPLSAAGLTLCALISHPTVAQLPNGYWDIDRARAILDKTLEITLAPDLSHLSENEHAAVDHLLEAGRIMQDLYESQHHPESHQARERLAELAAVHPGTATENLEQLYRLFRGPIATTLENERLPFLPVAEELPGKAVYPPTVTREGMSTYLESNANPPDILDERTLVRRASAENVRTDLATLNANPVLDTLHPGLRERLSRLAVSPDAQRLYGIPYSVAWAQSVLSVYDRLLRAADAMRTEDPDFSDYLRLRARDLLTGDYEAGDAAWVTGRFNNLNAEIGSYETYDDDLLGVKAFYAMSLLLRDRTASDALAGALTGLQAIENRLPHEPHRMVRGQIPVGVYHVIADFGQSRGANTATILPNDAAHSRKYGRTILLRYNILVDEAIFEQTLNRLRAATLPDFHDDLTLDGNFQRTLWHEVGHYLGVDLTHDGRNLDAALQQYGDLFEEMKADLVSLYTASHLHEIGYLSAEQLISMYAGGIRRVLLTNAPRRSQPYQTMQLMQWNFFLENGVLAFDRTSERMGIDYSRYHEVVGNLLTEVLAIQYAGDLARADEFVERYAYWNDDLHGIIAANIRDSIEYRYYLVRYASLDGA